MGIGMSSRLAPAARQRIDTGDSNMDMRQSQRVNGPDVLEAEWRAATSAVIRAQLDYARAVATEDEESPTLDDAWLRLWRAEQRQREILHELDGQAA